MEEFLIDIGENWEVVSAGILTLLASRWGTVTIRELFSKSTSKIIVNKLTAGLLRKVNKIKVKVANILNIVKYNKGVVDRMEQRQIQEYAKQDAFRLTMIESNAEAMEVLQDTYEAKLAVLTGENETIGREVVEEVEEEPQSEEVRLTRKERKAKKKAGKKAVKDEKVERIY
jgi:hypothetical protein